MTPENSVPLFVSSSVPDTVYAGTTESILLTLTTSGFPSAQTSGEIEGHVQPAGGAPLQLFQLRDSGEGGDVVPGDGVFSAMLSTDFASAPGLMEVVFTLDEYFQLRDTIRVLGGAKNFPPGLFNLITPDTLFLDAPPAAHFIYLDVIDPQGQTDIAEVKGYVYFPNSAQPNVTITLRREGIPPELLKGPDSYVYIFQPGDLALQGAGRYAIRFAARDHHGQWSDDTVSEILAVSNEANVPPVLSNMVVPDSAKVPAAGQNPLLLLLNVTVTDANGQADIRSVWFNSYLPPDGRPSTANPIFMWDDGGNTPGVVSGDDFAGDGIYSSVIQLPPGTPTGQFEFRFHADDRYRARADSLVHRVMVTQ